MEVSAFSKKLSAHCKVSGLCWEVTLIQTLGLHGVQNLTQSVFGAGLSTLLASLRWTGLSQMLSQIPHLAPHSVNALDRGSAGPGASHVMVQRSQLAWAGVQPVPSTDTAELFQTGLCSSSTELLRCFILNPVSGKCHYQLPSPKSD